MPLGIGLAIAGGVGALGSVGSSLIGASGAEKASSQQVALGQQALGIQQQYGSQGLAELLSLTNQGLGKQNNTLSNAQAYLPKYLGAARGIESPLLALGANTGGSALSTLQKLLTPGANQNATLEQLPGFQFAQGVGQQTTKNLGTTMGLGGNTLTAGANFATGLAQQNFGNLIAGLTGLANTGTTLASSTGNTLAGLFGAGALGGLNALTSAGNTELGALSGAGLGYGGTSAQIGTALGGTYQNIGQSMAQGTLGAANAYSSGLTGATGSLSNALVLNSILNGPGSGSLSGGALGSYLNPSYGTSFGGTGVPGISQAEISSYIQ